MTAYGYMDQSRAGMLLDGVNKEELSKIADGAVAFGLPLFADLGEDDIARAYTGTPDRFVGLALFAQKEPNAAEGYTDKDTIRALHMGRALVNVTGAVNSGDPVFYNASTKVFTGVSAVGLIALTGVKFVTTKNAQNLAAIELIGSEAFTVVS